MKTMKKLLALLLCLVMVCSTVPMQAFAAEAETSNAALLPASVDEAAVMAVADGDVAKVTDANGTETGYKSLQEAFDYIDSNNGTETGVGGSYTVTLLADAEGTQFELYPFSTWMSSALNVTFDLNGHTVKGDGTKIVISIHGGSASTPVNVTVMDSGDGGTITGGTGGIYFYPTGGTLNFNGGTITGNSGTSVGAGINGGGAKAAIVNINGGTISNNTAVGTGSANTGLGGGVYGYNINVTGGTITGNTAQGGSGSYTGQGGGICNYITGTSKITVTGGTITGNTATNAGDDIMLRGNGSTKITYSLADTMEYYVDGFKGTNVGDTNGPTARYDAESPVAWTTLSETSATKTTVGLKVVPGSDPEAPGNTPEASGPAAPTWDGKNVTPALVRVICDTDEAHAPLDIPWQHQSTSVYPGAEVVWNDELDTWTVDIRIDSISIYYGWLNFAEVYNEITHELVPDAPLPEGKYNIDTTLKWDEEAQLWVTMDEKPIEVHVSCKTEPTAPIHVQLKSYQIQVMGDLDGDGVYGETSYTNDSGIGELFTTSITEETYVLGEVVGSREEGFTVDVTVTLKNDDVFITNWIEKRAPGEDYVYNWARTPETFTFTLKYTGSLSGNLTGGGSGDWVLATTGQTFGAIGQAYVGKEAAVTYTDGVEGVVLFADQVTDTYIGEATPAFVGTPTREHYTFAGWTPAVTETVAGSTTYTAVWEPVDYTVSFYPVGSDKASVELEVAYGTSVKDAETGLPALTEKNAGAVAGYTASGWYYLDTEGKEVVFNETTVVKGDMKVYPSFRANTYTLTLDPDGGKVEPASVNVTYGSAVGKLPVPTREGYTFAGWVDKAGSKVTDTSVYSAAGDSTLKATWQKTAVKDPTSADTGDAGITMMLTLCALSGAVLVLLLSQKKRLFF